jgi:hypothetical protein
MSLEDEINARLRHLSEEIRAFRQNIDQLRRSDPPAPAARAAGKTRPPGPEPQKKPQRE